MINTGILTMYKKEQGTNMTLPYFIQFTPRQEYSFYKFSFQGNKNFKIFYCGKND